MLTNSPLLAAYRGLKPTRTPLWFMRQAGRYLPEYRAIREKHPMLEVITTPQLAAEVTLQPLRRFDFDAAIIFADILNPLIGMGAKLDFLKGEGPKIYNPVRTLDDVKRLKVPNASENVPYTLQAIELVTKELTPRGVPLIGFCGAPFTLSCYFINGEGDSNFHLARKLMLTDPNMWELLSEKLVEMTIGYLEAQVKAGASAVQIFDSWAGLLGPEQFKKYCLPYLTKIIVGFKKRCAAPFCYFATGTAGIFHEVAKLPADVFGIDWRQSLSESSKILDGRAVQGNLDPMMLFATKEDLTRAVERVLEDGAKAKSFIFNLGHGILPETPIASVEHVINLVRSRDE